MAMSMVNHAMPSASTSGGPGPTGSITINMSGAGNAPIALMPGHIIATVISIDNQPPQRVNLRAGTGDTLGSLLEEAMKIALARIGLGGTATLSNPNMPPGGPVDPTMPPESINYMGPTPIAITFTPWNIPSNTTAGMAASVQATCP